MQTRPGLLVFSDLDGTLLDHQSYSWAAAEPALARLRAMNAGLILATSKTAAEVAPLRDEIGFPTWPAIVENGGGLLEPSTPASDAPTEYQRIRDLLRQLPPGFVGFGDLSAQEVAKVTGLSPVASAQAKQRLFSEPGTWTGTEDDFQAFHRAAEKAGLTLQRGGRFVSLSFGGTKALRVAELIRRYAPAHSVALGDAPNDVEMLQAVDTGIIVANPGAPDLPPLPGEQTGRIRRTEREGPRGWADAINALLDELSQKKEALRHG